MISVHGTWTRRARTDSQPPEKQAALVPGCQCQGSVSAESGDCASFDWPATSPALPAPCGRLVQSRCPEALTRIRRARRADAGARRGEQWVPRAVVTSGSYRFL